MTRLILASASAARHRLLAAAGIACEAIAAAIDEAPVKRACQAAGGSPGAAALELAGLKALDVANRHPGATVIGADQMLDCDGRWFDKPKDRDAARAQLQALAGRTHHLSSAVALAENGMLSWRHVEPAHLTMREPSEAFLEAYLDRAGEGVLGSVGAYQFEGLGAQLFERVEGDYFAILGLPLLPLLAALRERGLAAR